MLSLPCLVADGDEILNFTFRNDGDDDMDGDDGDDDMDGDDGDDDMVSDDSDDDMVSEVSDDSNDGLVSDNDPRAEGLELEHTTFEQVQAWTQVSTSLGIPVPEQVLYALSDMEKYSFLLPRADQLTSSSAPSEAPPIWWQQMFREWHHFLIVGLCAGNLTHLEAQQLYNQDEYGPIPPDFRNLRVFSCIDGYEFTDLSWFLRRAPLVNRVAVGRMHVNRPDPFAAVDPPAPITTIQKVSTASKPFHCSEMLKVFPQVIDLEVHLTSGSSEPNVPTADSWPASMKAQLRRLCWSNSLPLFPEQISDEDAIVVPPINEFTNLEILKITGLSLRIALKRSLSPNESVEEISAQLPSILPLSLRILHIAYGLENWTTVMIELNALASAKMTSLRNLSIIKISHGPTANPDDGTFGDALENSGVVQAMEASGIDLRFEVDHVSVYTSERGLLPTLQGTLDSALSHARGGLAEDESFALED
ncbi:hypothetical protein diail_7722 [Diaporthe ilicicola]|nr:hypothetical protein diail_7722 [Diaporthe ilicicola]